ATEFSQDHMALSPESTTVEGKTAAGVGIYCMDVGCSLFPQQGTGIQRTGVVCDPERLAVLRELVQSGLESFVRLRPLAESPAAGCGFKSSLAGILCQVAAPAPDQYRASTGYSRHRALRVFRRAREFIHHHLADGIPIAALCSHAGASRRSLESVFRSV